MARTEPVLLREYRDSDAEERARLANDRGIWLGLRDAFPHPCGLHDARRFIAVAHVFESNAGLQRLYAVPYASNPASARVLEKAGFRLEGTLRRSAIKDGTILDQWMYAILRDEAAPAAGGARPR